ncbi:hypothetical protein ACFVH6_43985 [Spirillospora sp. NPDC127200]
MAGMAGNGRVAAVALVGLEKADEWASVISAFVAIGGDDTTNTTS